MFSEMAIGEAFPRILGVWASLPRMLTSRAIFASAPQLSMYKGAIGLTYEISPMYRESLQIWQKQGGTWKLLARQSVRPPQA